jgi:octaprenyl-diphosphate synthase
MTALSVKLIWETLENNLDKDIALINSMAQSLFKKKGKALRSELLIGLFERCELENKPSREDILSAGAIVEIIHTGTLVHDDVIDNSEMRRGALSHHKVFGNTCSILMGDYLFTRAFSLAFKLEKSSEFLKQLALVTEQLVKGELLQIQFQQQRSLDPETYQTIIAYKTGSLFSLSLAVFNDPSLLSLGSDLGCLFQKIDDLLDYFSTPSILGKPIGTDFKERKVTFPILFASKINPTLKEEFFHSELLFNIFTQSLLLYKDKMINDLKEERALLLQKAENILNEKQYLFVQTLLDKFFLKLELSQKTACQQE